MRYIKKLSLLCVVSAGLIGCGEVDQQSPTPVQASPAVGQPAAARESVSAVVGGDGTFVQLDQVTSTSLAKSRNLCSLERINGIRLKDSGTVSIAANGRVEFNGWIVDPTKGVPDGFVIVLAGEKTYGLNGVVGRKREDVARSLKSDRAMNAGFQVKGVMGEVAPGAYSVSFLQELDSVVSSCNTRESIVVGG